MITRITLNALLAFLLFTVVSGNSPACFAQAPPSGIDANLIGGWVDGPGGNPTYRYQAPNGQWFDCVQIPGALKPADWDNQVAIAQQAVHTQAGSTAVMLNNVPAYDWAYGCVPTGGAMMLGYHDRTGMANIYTGPTNSGVMPLDNSSWGSGENPLSATHIGIDGRTTYAHVEDYWDPAGGYADPYETAGRAAHADDCLADFMGTSRGEYLTNGWTTVMLSNMGYKYYPSTSAVSPASEPVLDAAYGIVEYLKSRGYPDYSDKVYNQLIQGAGLIPELGYTFDDYKAEIDAGRPVIIHAGTHTLVGIGYKDPDVVYVHTTWDYIHPDPSTTTHLMTWGGFFQGHEHFAVTVFEIDRDDYDAPFVTTATPTGSDVNVTSPVTVTFSEAMNQAVTQGAFSITPSVSGSFAWSAEGTVLTFTPSSNLATNTTYTVKISIAARDLSGLTFNEEYSWTFKTGLANKVDGLVYNNASATFLGDNIYNSTGQDQTESRTVAINAKTTFYVRGQNDGVVNDQLRFKGPASASGWTLKYIDSATNANITSQVTGSGWLTSLVGIGGIRAIKIEATASAAADDSIPLTISITVSSNTDPGITDTVKCIPGIFPSYKPDAMVYQASTATFIGDNIYNTTGQWQTETSSVNNLAIAKFYIRGQNDGKLSEKLCFKGPAGDAKWIVQYFDSATNNDITAAVTGAGWSTGSVPPAGIRSIKCHIIPQSAAIGNSTFTALVTVASTTKTDRVDVAKCITSVLPRYTPDALVYESSTVKYIGDNIYNTTGVGQAVGQSVAAGAKTTFYIRGQNDANISQMLIFSGPAGNSDWNIKYVDCFNGNDITAAMVSSSGWSTPSIGPTLVRTVKMEVIPAATVVPGSICTISLGVFSGANTALYDIVQCSITVIATSKPDILPYQASSASFIGNNVYNSNGSGQTESRSIVSGAKTTYYARLQNDGLSSEPLLVKGPAGDSNWTIRYVNSGTGADITSAVTGSGWTTDSIPVGSYRSIKIEVTPKNGLTAGTNLTLTLTLASTFDASKIDVGKFITTIK